MVKYIYSVAFWFLILFLYGPVFANNKIQGYVYDSDRNPLRDAYVTLRPGPIKSITGNNGYFSFNELPAGIYFLEIQHIGYQKLTIDSLHLRPTSVLPLDTLFMKLRVFTSDEMIVTATRRERPADEIPLPVNFVPQRVILERNAKTSAEALRAESGLFIQKTNHGGGSAIIRGLSSNQILILVDGIRLNNALYRLGNHQYLTTVDNHMLDRIEVIRGPASALYGSDAMGGVINLVTRWPAYNQTQPIWNYRLLGRFASADRERTMRVELNHQQSNYFFGGGLSYKKYGDLRRGSNSDYKRLERSDRVQSPSGFEALDGDARIGIRLPCSTELKLAYQGSRQMHVPRYDKYENDDYYLWQYHPQKRDLVYAIFRKDFEQNHINTLEATISLHRQLEGREIQANPDEIRTSEKDQDLTTGVQLKWLSSLGDQHTIQAGVDWYTDKVSSSRQVMDPQNNTTVPAANSRYPDGATYSTLGLYVQDGYQLGSRIQGISGLRYSQASTRFQLADSLIGSFHQSYRAFTLHTGFFYQLFDPLKIMVHFGQAFRAPNLSDLAKFGTSKGDIFEVPNADLQPEKVYSLDLGIRVKTVDWRLHMTAYYARILDLLGSADDTFAGLGFIERDGRILKVKSKQNLGRGFISGLEVSGTWQTEGHWRLNGNLNYTYGQNTSLNEPIGGIPPLFGRLGVRWKEKRWFSEFFLRFAGKQNRFSADDMDDPRIPLQGTPAWQTVNVTCGYQFNHPVYLQFSVENMLDYNYREHGSGINAPGRSFIFTLQLGRPSAH